MFGMKLIDLIARKKCCYLSDMGVFDGKEGAVRSMFPFRENLCRHHSSGSEESVAIVETAIDSTSQSIVEISMVADNSTSLLIMWKAIVLGRSRKSTNDGLIGDY